MNISNRLLAPCLLIAAMVVLILFQSVFFKGNNIIYTEPEQQTEQPEQIENDEDFVANTVDYIIFNNVKYKPDRFFILAVISNICAFLLPAVFYVKLKGAGYTKNLKFGLPKLKHLSLVMYMFVVLVSGTILINSLMFFSSGTAVNPESVLTVFINTGGNPVYDMGVLISFVLLPALCEEFFFRSVLSAEYEKYGVFCALILTSLAFAASHFSLKFFPSYFFAAVIFYIVAKITNSVLFSAVIHAGYNLYSIYLWDKLSGALQFEQNRFIFIFIIAVVFIVFIAFVLNSLESIYYNKAYNNEPSPVYLPENDSKSAKAAAFFKSLLSPTFIAVIVIFFIYINI